MNDSGLEALFIGFCLGGLLVGSILWGVLFHPQDINCAQNCGTVEFKLIDEKCFCSTKDGWSLSNAEDQ